MHLHTSAPGKRLAVIIFMYLHSPVGSFDAERFLAPKPSIA
jgi:hypothetical protein